MSAAFAQRGLALAGIALLAVIVALALISRRSTGTPSATAGPQPVSVAGSGWYSAVVGITRLGVGRRTACGQRMSAATIGIAHPVLPCGAKLFVLYRGVQVLTQVIDRGPNGPGHEFDVTPALARRLGFRGVREVRWAFAQA